MNIIQPKFEIIEQKYDNDLLKVELTEEQQKIFESFKYNVSKAGTVYGVGNYVLPILRSDSDKIGFNVFGLDTHNYLNEKTGTQQNLYGQKFENAVLVENPIYGTLFDPGGKYETIHADQIRWYGRKARPDRTLPSRPHGFPNPGHGRRPVADRKGPAELR